MEMPRPLPQRGSSCVPATARASVRAVAARLVSLPDELVRAYDEGEAIGDAEGLGDVGPELGDARAPRARVNAAPHRRVGIGRVRPQRLQRARVAVRVPERPAHGLQLGEAPRAVADAAVQHEYLTGDEGAERQPVERAVHRLKRGIAARRQPHSHLREEAVVAHRDVHLAELVVATHEEDSRGVHDFEREEYQHNL